jgi:hypothetical protein
MSPYLPVTEAAPQQVVKGAGTGPDELCQRDSLDAALADALAAARGEVVVPASIDPPALVKSETRLLPWVFAGVVAVPLSCTFAIVVGMATASLRLGIAVLVSLLVGAILAALTL